MAKDYLSRLRKPKQGLLSTVIVATSAAVMVAGLSLTPASVIAGDAVAHAEDTTLDLGQVSGGIDETTTNRDENNTDQRGSDCIRYGYSSQQDESVPAKYD